MTQDFLLEIGCEELPSDYLAGLLPESASGASSSGLGFAAASILSELKVSWEKVRVFAAPRRLVVWVQGVEAKVQEVVEGPPEAIAVDSQGRFTPAALGFAKKQGVKVSQLQVRAGTRGRRLVLERSLSAPQVLSQAIARIIEKIYFPKTMRWDETGVRFARPIRWLLALYGSAPVSCPVGRLKSGRVTFGPRRARPRGISVSSPSAYFSTLARLRVKLQEGIPLERSPEGIHPSLKPSARTKRDEILGELKAMARSVGGRLEDDQTEEFKGLLDTVTFLAEDPVVVAGSFKREYLDLPPQVLACAMAKHLKLFSVFGPGGKLLPKFLAVLEGSPNQKQRVVSNLEQVLEARFTDARFFYEEDVRTPLSAKIEGLQGVVFHEKLGTVADRIPRLTRLMEALADGVKPSYEKKDLISKAASLCKADLVTQMVREFPSLQGVMGGTYAAGSGEPQEAAQALLEQYHPKSAQDPLPKSPLGALLSLADRLDTLIGYFGVGLTPSGSADPYALRRQALGVVRILTNETASFSWTGLAMDRVLQAGIESWGPRLTVSPLTILKELQAFLRERWKWLACLRYPQQEEEWQEAVLASDPGDLAGAWQRLNLLIGLWDDPKGRNLVLTAAKVAERAGRMVKTAPKEETEGKVDPSAFEEPVEKVLWERWQKVSPVLAEQLQRQRYRQALMTYGQLYEPLHQFFEKVFVMDENRSKRRNRLVFLKELHAGFAHRFADLAKLPLAGMEPGKPFGSEGGAG